MQLETNPSKYLYQWRYVELGRYVSADHPLVRVQDGHKNPIFADPNEVESFRERYKNVGLYTSVWYHNARDLNHSIPFAGFYMDFDSSDLSISYEEVQKVVLYLEETTPSDGIRVYFSGKKGFHAEIDSAVLGIAPSVDLPGIFRFIAGKIRDELNLRTLDFAVYDARRMWRLPNSAHQLSGLFKVELGRELLLGGSTSAILEYAQQPQPEVERDLSFNAIANEWFRNYSYQQEKEAMTLEEKISRFERFGTGRRVSINESESQFNPLTAFDGDCEALKNLWNKAEQTHNLEHEERLFLCSMLTYSDEAIEYLHAILRLCDDYSPEKSSAHINDWIHRRESGRGGRPFSCRRAKEAGIICGNCDKMEPHDKMINAGGQLITTGELAEPSPIRFIYPKIKKGLQ